MCGIAGFVDFNNQSSEPILQAVTKVLAHRGPDGSGYSFFQTAECQVGLGHRRLSIIDLTNAASQPMQFRQTTIVYNGEIYNFREIRNTLEAEGHHFDTQSDTEVILHAWDAWREKMVDRFIGMFAIVLYEADKQALYCFRDRAGVKPMYYYWHNNLFLFASELKSFHQHPSFQKEINPQALHQFMQYGYIMGPLSIFKHTHKLIPGHYLHLQLPNRTFKVLKYWDVFDVYQQPTLNMTLPEAEAELKQLLLDACQYRMVSDVPVGVFLSGGYDSTAVTAMLQTGRTEKIKTFSIGFQEDDHNEAPFAAAVAKHLQTDHTEYICTTREAQEIIPEIPYFCDEPFGDSSIIPTTLVSRLARERVTVALSADAGDETFAGYAKYPQALRLLKNLTGVPYPLRKTGSYMVGAAPDWLLKVITGNTAVTIKKKRIESLLRKKELNAADILDLLMSQVYTNEQLAGLLSNGIRQPPSYFSLSYLLNDRIGSLNKMLAMDYKTYLCDDILVKVDRAGMSVSLEGREPLLDHRLIEFAARLPESYKLQGSITKQILKNIVHEYVPKDIMDRPKMGFGVPVFRWLRGDLAHYVHEYMKPADFNKHGLFKPEGVKYIMDRFQAGDRNYNSLFWYLLMFQMWHRRWME